MGIHLFTPKGAVIENAISLDFQASNSEVEYKLVIVGMQMAKAFRIHLASIFTDSKLVAYQVNEVILIKIRE